ncbi:hydrogenase maturation protease [Propionivibrio sp.]|uniref:hydrogenase maturation protease n=1 Tax=Propionivibrio sp. TaxID=2212460 RepID=UPI0025DE9C4C|nr:hydrogenase maturation protease [Propionivibrio sp.]
MTPKPFLLFALGNESRGDDALGPLLARRLQDWLASTGKVGPVEIIEEFQLQIEHTLDLKDRELVLFVDAGEGTAAPFAFSAARVGWGGRGERGVGYTTHAVAPEALLGLYVKVHAAAPPPAFILCLAGEGFELGAPLSAVAAAHFEAGFAFCQGLFDSPSLPSWQASCNEPFNVERTPIA